MPGDDDHCAECGSDLAPGEDDVCPICSIVLDEIAKLAWQRALASVAAKARAVAATIRKMQAAKTSEARVEIIRTDAKRNSTKLGVTAGTYRQWVWRAAVGKMPNVNRDVSKHEKVLKESPVAKGHAEAIAKALKQRHGIKTPIGEEFTDASTQEHRSKVAAFARDYRSAGEKLVDKLAGDKSMKREHVAAIYTAVTGLAPSSRVQSSRKGMVHELRQEFLINAHRMNAAAHSGTTRPW